MHYQLLIILRRGDLDYHKYIVFYLISLTRRNRFMLFGQGRQFVSISQTPLSDYLP